MGTQGGVETVSANLDLELVELGQWGRLLKGGVGEGTLSDE